MRRIVWCAALAGSLPTMALAQIGGVLGPLGSGIDGPLENTSPYTVRDRQSGNTYRVTPQYGGGARVQGNNYNTGSQWTTTVRPDGSMRGTDSSGNAWQQNRSGSYYNFGTGKSCYGTGALRTCY